MVFEATVRWIRNLQNFETYIAKETSAYRWLTEPSKHHRAPELEWKGRRLMRSNHQEGAPRQIHSRWDRPDDGQDRTSRTTAPRGQESREHKHTSGERERGLGKKALPLPREELNSARLQVLVITKDQ